MNANRLAATCLRLGNTVIKQNEAKLQKAGLCTSIVRLNIKGTVHPGYKKLRAKMEKFQVDDDVPIHLKGGPVDAVLYCITLGACAAGLIGSFDYIYHSAFPKKPDGSC